jgi:hypothetical protein
MRLRCHSAPSIFTWLLCSIEITFLSLVYSIEFNRYALIIILRFAGYRFMARALLGLDTFLYVATVIEFITYPMN